MIPAPIFARNAVFACLMMGLGMPCRADTHDADVAELRRVVEQLQAQNQALAKRLSALEAAKAGVADSAAALGGAARGEGGGGGEGGDLARRVRELEIGKIAQEDATRAIIRDSVSTLGSKINQAVSLSGSIEVLGGSVRDFSNPAASTASTLRLNTAELDLEISATPWASASLVLGYADGGDAQFRNTKGFDSGVDRLTVDTAALTIGDPQRFPIYLKAGRMTLGFGSSTGVHRADVLSIDNPLTTDAFETRRDAIGFGFGWPTPRPTRAPLPVQVPPVHAQALEPLVAAAARRLGYTPIPERPRQPAPVSPAAEAPPFYGALLFYQGDNIGAARGLRQNVNGRLGYRSSGHCGKPYGELSRSGLCPWSVDISVDAISSVFDSRFLAAEYRPFLAQTGAVRGMASTLKMTLGALQVVGEWTGATSRAKFQDDAGIARNLKPSAWQLGLGYQFDWNPWVSAIGAQGSYVALGYSRSRDLAGVTRQLENERARAGHLPRSRWALTFGEWVQEGVKVQLELSRTMDYAVSQGGTGGTGGGVQMTLTHDW